MEEIPSSNAPVFTGISDSNKSRARYIYIYIYIYIFMYLCLVDVYYSFLCDEINAEKSVPENIYLVTIEVRKLYTNIRNAVG